MRKLFRWFMSTVVNVVKRVVEEFLYALFSGYSQRMLPA